MREREREVFERDECSIASFTYFEYPGCSSINTAESQPPPLLNIAIPSMFLYLLNIDDGVL